jgi:hypothetical protein
MSETAEVVRFCQILAAIVARMMAKQQETKKAA